MDPPFSRVVLGLFFVVAGTLHFFAPGVYERIMSPYLPLHRVLVLYRYKTQLSGVQCSRRAQ